jgi:hypothetical protein
LGDHNRILLHLLPIKPNGAHDSGLYFYSIVSPRDRIPNDVVIKSGRLKSWDIDCTRAVIHYFKSLRNVICDRGVNTALMPLVARQIFYAVSISDEMDIQIGRSDSACTGLVLTGLQIRAD